MPGENYPIDAEEDFAGTAWFTFPKVGQPQPLWNIPHEESASNPKSAKKMSLFFFIAYCFKRYKDTKCCHQYPYNISKQIIPLAAAPRKNILLQYFNGSAVYNSNSGKYCYCF